MMARFIGLSAKREFFDDFADLRTSVDFHRVSPAQAEPGPRGTSAVN
jgi:hypothetical protein